MDVTLTQRSRTDTTPQGPLEWVISGDTGISSTVIWAVMMDVRVDVMRSPSVPHDPPDFGRCYRLLQLMPGWRTQMHKVTDRCPRWQPFVEHWGELEEMYEACLGESSRYEGGTEASRAMYQRMQELLKQSRDYA